MEYRALGKSRLKVSELGLGANNFGWWADFAAERGHTIAEPAIAWLLTKPWISSVMAGARTVEQLSANLPAMQWKLTDDEIAEVNARVA